MRVTAFLSSLLSICVTISAFCLRLGFLYKIGPVYKKSTNQPGHQPNQVIIFAMHATCSLYMLTARSGHIVVITFFKFAASHRGGGNRKRYQNRRTRIKKSIETVFSIAICRHCCDKRQSITLFLTIFDLRSSINLAFSIATYPVCA